MVADFGLATAVMLNRFGRHDVCEFDGGLQRPGESRDDAKRICFGNYRIRDAFCVCGSHAGDDKVDGGSSNVRALQGNVADVDLFHVERAPRSKFRFDRVSDEYVHRNVAWLRWHGVGHAFDAPFAYVAVFFVPANGAFERCRHGFAAKAQFFLRAGAIHEH